MDLGATPAHDWAPPPVEDAAAKPRREDKILESSQQTSAPAQVQVHPGAGEDPTRVHAVASVLGKIAKWKDYANYGEPLKGSRVIPMKTPLTLALQRRTFSTAAVDEARQQGDTDGDGAGRPRTHTVHTFVEEQRALGRTVGLIVDLSNHDCLYEDDLTREYPMLHYEHFFFVAKQYPERAGCQKVNACITSYLEANPEHYVAIHCSYGFNRTGFICAAYLVEELRFTAVEALAAFAASRSPGIHHENFVSEFMVRYGEATAKTPTAAGCDRSGQVGQGHGRAGEEDKVKDEHYHETLGPMAGKEMLRAMHEAGAGLERAKTPKTCALS